MAVEPPARGTVTAEEPAFPRGRALPRQSPRFWVEQKDRYLRQLLIRDIEELTGRALVVYYTDTTTNAQIDSQDDQYLIELLRDARGAPSDLLLETNGGATDDTEKLASILRAAAPDLRVVVPRRAKSNGTLLALAAGQIVMGMGAELGPMDPLLPSPQGYLVPAQYILEAPDAFDPVLRRFAEQAILQTRKLARALLATGMLRGRTAAEIERVVDRLSSRDTYHSHGSVIDGTEAAAMGLTVATLDPDDPVWGRLWLLRAMYEADTQRGNLSKVFEGRVVSQTVRRG